MSTAELVVFVACLSIAGCTSIAFYAFLWWVAKQ